MDLSLTAFIDFTMNIIMVVAVTIVIVIDGVRRLDEITIEIAIGIEAQKENEKVTAVIIMDDIKIVTKTRGKNNALVAHLAAIKTIGGIKVGSTLQDLLIYNQL